MISGIIISSFLWLLIISIIIYIHKNKTLFHQVNDSYKTISIVIACKNEAKNIETLINSLANLQYPKELYEIIFVDDNSDDDTFEILYSYNLKVFKSTNHGKKAALQTGINNSSFDWIALTDADCIVHQLWLKYINYFIHKNNKTNMFIGYSPELYSETVTHPSHFRLSTAEFRYFKQIAIAINYAATTIIGLPFSCTGRNLVFEKQSFYKVGGFEGLYHYQSGDDKLLLKRFKEKRKNITYLPYPPVYTIPVAKALLQAQNTRRFSKFKMSSILWQLGLIMIGLLFLGVFIEIFINFNRSIYFFLFSVFSYVVYVWIGFKLHGEKFKCIYILFSIYFPYYLAYQMINSHFKRWRWK